jgi:hypothetical protein
MPPGGGEIQHLSLSKRRQFFSPHTLQRFASLYRTAQARLSPLYVPL